MNNLTARLAGFTLAVAALSATGTGALYLFIAEQRSDATVVNLAGAQRMLSQKISKETLLLVAGQMPATTLVQSVGRFDRVLTGLLDGDTELKLPRCGDDAVRAQLERVRVLWTPFRRAVDNVVAGTERDAALSYVATHNVELLTEMNTAVKLFEQAATRRVERLIWMQAGLMAALLVLLGCAWTMLLAPMAREMAHAVREVSAISVAVCQASHHIAQQSDWLAHASTEQAEALDRANSAAQEINASATSGAESSRAAAKVMEQSEHEFASAASTLGEVVETTREMAESAQKISAVNALIERIAFQTNILALNANVEAARAGEAGLGFAVVAEEVRRLAIESSKASGDTSTLITNSVAIVKRGNEKVDRANSAMGTIQADWTHLGQLAHSVIAASDQQAEGIARVTSSIGELQSSTQRIAAASEESASAASELDAQASSLEQVVAALSRLVGDTAATR